MFLERLPGKVRPQDEQFKNQQQPQEQPVNHTAWGSMGTLGDPWEHMGAHGNPMGTLGYKWDLLLPSPTPSHNYILHTSASSPSSSSSSYIHTELALYNTQPLMQSMHTSNTDISDSDISDSVHQTPTSQNLESSTQREQ